MKIILKNCSKISKIMKTAFCVHFDSKSTKVSHLTRIRIVVLLYYFLCTLPDEVSVLVNPLPQNKAVVNGATRVAFNCSSTNGWDFISWSVLQVGGSTSKPITTGSAVALPYRDTYEVSQTGSLTNTLIIKTVNESLAGTYTCGEFGSGSASAQLIVYNSDPVCTSNVSPGLNLTQGQSVQMSCSFSFTATNSSVSVNMAWSKGSPSSPVESPSPVITTTGTLTTAVSTISQTVGYSSPFPVYQCKTSFTVVGTNATNAATNDPSFTNTAQPYSSPINVLYFNPNCSTKGANSGDSVYFGTSIICQADANPSPSFRWSNGTNATLSNNAAVQITRDDLYTCTASNSVGRCTLSITLTTHSPPAPSTEDGLSETNKIIIGVVVGIGGFIVLIILLTIIICWRIRKNSSEKTKKNGQISVENISEDRLTTDPMRENSNQVNGNNGAYETLTDRSGQQPAIYTHLQPPGVENPAMNVGTYEALTDRTNYEREYDRLRVPLE